MIGFLDDIWTAFRAAFYAARRLRHHSVRGWYRRDAIRDAAFLAAWTPEELRIGASQWGGASCRRELQRRGLS
jgi:hypothetical protein